MKEFSVKKATLSAIAVLLSVLLIVTVSFGTYFSSGAWASLIWNAFKVLYTIAVIALIAANLFVFLFAPRKACEILGIVTVVLAILFSFIHLIYIITDVGRYIDYYGGFNGLVIILVDGLLPLALLAVVSVAYILCKVKMPEDTGLTAAAPAATAATEASATEAAATVAVLPVREEPEKVEEAATYQKYKAEEPAPAKEESKSYSHNNSGKMPQDRIDAIIMAHRDNIPSEKVLSLKNALENVSADKYNLLCNAPVKNPITVLLLSIFLGGWGVDRFYLGDTGLGILKLLFNWLTGGIWGLVDIYFCYKKAKEQNLNTLLQIIG